MLLDKAQLLTLSAPEMTVLVGGLRVLGANARRLSARRVHEAPGPADERLLRQPGGHVDRMEAHRPTTPTKAATARPARPSGPATRVDLAFGSNSQLRAIGRGLRPERQRRQVRARLRGRLDQGDEPRPVRFAVILIAASSCEAAPEKIRALWTDLLARLSLAAVASTQTQARLQLGALGVRRTGTITTILARELSMALRMAADIGVPVRPLDVQRRVGELAQLGMLCITLARLWWRGSGWATRRFSCQ
jgi:hypothetical protein